MISIKVLGPGCPNCRRLEEEVKKAVNNLAIEAEIEKVSDHQKFLEYGLVSTPGLVINEKLVSSGRVLGEADIVALLAEVL